MRSSIIASVTLARLGLARHGIMPFVVPRIAGRMRTLPSTADADPVHLRLLREAHDRTPERALANGRLVKEIYEQGVTSLVLAGERGEPPVRLFDFAHAVARAGDPRVFVAGGKRIGVVDDGKLRTVDAADKTRALLWHEGALVRVVWLDALKPRWFIETWDPDALVLLSTVETAPVWRIASHAGALLVLAVNGLLAIGAPPPDPTTDYRSGALNAAELRTALGPGYALVARGDRIAVTPAGPSPVMVAIPPKEQPRVTRALPEVGKDWVQDDSYSSSNVYWLAHEGRRTEITYAETFVDAWIEETNAVVVHEGSGQTLRWKRLDPATMSLTKIGRDPGVLACGARYLVTHGWHGDLAAIRTIDGERLAARNDASLELVAGSPVEPWIVARRKDTLVVVDARTLTELASIEIAASAVRKMTCADDGTLTIVDSDDETHVFGVEL